VHTRPGDRSKGLLIAGHHALRVALGRGGILANKFEGDGGTPIGRFRLLRLWWRADRAPVPRTFLPVRRIRPNDAWSEDPSSRHYNQPFRKHPDEPGDRLWREDNLYDFIIEISHNTRPRISRRGSAVFIHAAREGFKPTAGCVALELKSLKRLLARLGPRTTIYIR